MDLSSFHSFGGASISLRQVIGVDTAACYLIFQNLFPVDLFFVD